MSLRTAKIDLLLLTGKGDALREEVQTPVKTKIAQT